MTNTTDAPTAQVTEQDPRANTVSIIGFVLAFVVPPVGIIVSGIAVSKAGKKGIDSKLAKWGLTLSIVFTVLYLVFVGIGTFAAISLQSASALSAGALSTIAL